MSRYGFGGFAAMFTKWAPPQSKSGKEEDTRVETLSLDTILPEDDAFVLDTSFGFQSLTVPEQDFQTQAQLINEYRAMSMHHDVDNAIDDVVNAMITTDEEEDPIAIDVSSVPYSEKIRKTMIDEFNNILHMLNFNACSYERARQWYVDGRLLHHLVVDEKKMQEGIKKIQLLDPRALRKVREVEKKVDEERIERVVRTETYFIYDPAFIDAGDDTGGSYNKAFGQYSQQRLRLSVDSVVQTHSGITTPNGRIVLSHLEKARKPLNNLKMIEDAVVVYRITRAPERRVFYIDVGNLPKKAAEEYLEKIMSKYQSKMIYNPVSGMVEGKAHQVSMMEDYWLPRRDGKGTEIDTLAGGQGLGDIEDVLYFQRKLFRALNVPISRLEPDSGSMVLGGRQAEISRDEWKFQKFISRLRRRFVTMFLDIMRVQLVLKKVCTDEEWESKIAPNLKFVFQADGFAKEAKETEELQDQVNLLNSVEPFIGKYFTKRDVMRRVLKMTDEEIAEFEKRVAEEIKAGIIPDPKAQSEEEEGGPFGQ